MARKVVGKAKAWADNLRFAELVTPATRRWVKRHLARAERRAGKLALMAGDDPEGSVVLGLALDGSIGFPKRVYAASEVEWDAVADDPAAEMSAEDVLVALVQLLTGCSVDSAEVCEIAEKTAGVIWS